MTYLGDADGELSMDQLRYHGLLSTTKPERNTMTLTYDPDYDNCAGMPGCGGERVLFYLVSRACGLLPPLLREHLRRPARARDRRQDPGHGLTA